MKDKKDKLSFIKIKNFLNQGALWIKVEKKKNLKNGEDIYR